jgi:hypothetical protein
MDESPKQQPIAPAGKATPDPNTDFGDEAFDYGAMPQSKVSAGGLNEWIFGLMRPKSKISAKPLRTSVQQPVRKEYPENSLPTPSELTLNGERIIPSPAAGFEIQNGLLIRKKTLPERVRDQIKFPVLKNTQSLINGAALVIFAVGASIIYSELPNRPELVVGILIVAISANIIISNR